MKLSAVALLLVAPAALARPSRCNRPGHHTSLGAAAPSQPSAAVPVPVVSESAAAPESIPSAVQSSEASAAAPAQSDSWLSSIISYVSASASATAPVSSDAPAASEVPAVSSTEAPSSALTEAASSAVLSSTTDATSAPISSAPAYSSATSEAIVTSESSSSSSVAPTSTSTSSAATATSTAGSTWDYLSAASYSGTSTYYGGNLNGGACSFSTVASLPAGILGTAYSGAVWDNAAECGACIEVVGLNGATIKAMIVDKCPECEQGHLDLFPDAFKAVGGTTGLVDTTYRFVECGITSPIILHNKEGTSQYWFSMQVINANEPVASLEVSTDGGKTWTATARTEYNFFEYQSGFRTASFDVRVTSITGNTVTYAGATPDAQAQFTTSSNF